MVRAATFSDLAPLHALVMEMGNANKHFPDVKPDEDAAKALIMQAVQRNGGKHNGGCLVNVYEHDGQLEGFMVGTLQRVHHIGNRLEAMDMFLYCTKKAPARAALSLVDAYIDWAEQNPKVAKIYLSWTDILGTNGEKLEKLYSRKGFHRTGGIFERAVA